MGILVRSLEIHNECMALSEWLNKNPEHTPAAGGVALSLLHALHWILGNISTKPTEFLQRVEDAAKSNTILRQS